MCSPCVNSFNKLQNYFISSKFFHTSSYWKCYSSFWRKSYSVLFLRWTFCDGWLVSFAPCRAWIVVKITSWSQWIYLQSNVNLVMVIQVSLHLGFLGQNCNAIDTNLSNERQGQIESEVKRERIGKERHLNRRNGKNVNEKTEKLVKICLVWNKWHSLILFEFQLWICHVIVSFQRNRKLFGFENEIQLSLNWFADGGSFMILVVVISLICHDCQYDDTNEVWRARI